MRFETGNRGSAQQGQRLKKEKLNPLRMPIKEDMAVDEAGQAGA
jgi:hypothetical protein